MLGAAATQETVGIVRSGVRKLIDAVKACDEDAGKASSITFESRLGGIEGRPRDCE